MTLPDELQRLLPQALDVIRYMGRRESGADIQTIMKGTGLSERVARKSLRRLVTRYFVDMSDERVYALTTKGQQAVEDLRVYDGMVPAAAGAPGETSELIERQARRLSVLVPQELVIRSPALVRIGFGAPVDGSTPLKQPGRVILRISAPGCDVEPVERPLEVAVDAAAGPVQFRLVPRQEGPVRIKVEVYQLVIMPVRTPLGGMYFELNVAGFPTPKSAEAQVLGASVALHPGVEG